MAKEKQPFQIDKALEQIQPQLDERDKKALEIANLKAHRATITASIAQPGGKMRELQAQIDEKLKNSQPTDELDAEFAVLAGQRDTAQQRLNHLDKELLPQARQALTTANAALKRATLSAIFPFRRGCENLMSRRFVEGMDYFDEYNTALENFCAEHKIDLLAGVKETAPVASENRLWQLMENGGLQSPTGQQ